MSRVVSASTVGATAGPAVPQIRVWDDIAVEGQDESVDFRVELQPAATSAVTVDYRTKDIRATAPEDYEATSGTLRFAPGETEKTVSVPIVDDAVEDSGEDFALLLSNVSSGAQLAIEGTYGTIYNAEDVLAGFSLVDTAAGTDLGTLREGGEVTLDDPVNGSYGVRVETLPGAQIGSVRLDLSGAKTVTHTDEAAPWSL